MPRKKEELSLEQLLFRQINYTIIRQLWNRMDTPPVFQNGSIYEVLGLKPNRYSRIVRGGYTNLGNTELTHMERTGLSRDIFNGKKMLNLRVAIKSGKEEKIVSADRDWWIDYLSTEDEFKNSANAKVIKDALKQLNSDYIHEHYPPGDDMYRLCMYFLTGKAATENSNHFALSDVRNRIANISWEYLASLSDADSKKLNSYISSLEQGLELAKAVRIYRTVKKRK